MSIHLRILPNKAGNRFRVQYRCRFLFWTYWVDTSFVRAQGRRLPVVYPTREMAEEHQAEVARVHRLRHSSNW
ncbi:hypothetical protein P9A44_gp56 [Xanthomonas phage vB_Xar_IVIA-DoCa5]|uniref:Uncharacterized protein n=1 Tax=Xanthomonas phage vB_Xar_IVIA-DoCa5 TaxID=2975532 RepID=A0A9X9JQK5_9CAUD|nr:hypothetical protein P9A44_gp56 [Xanthomonas phage vB_Xar_IVIA-DoCa5]UYA98726.1 hypothetical protein IVIADoCa5_56 [Xanthomonas phage vB_Xar_IVIA-DoCa5]